ncbi:hypothetical protein NO2_0969 [Candidatus Termititenax persephonae]|uniref:PEGA domain-containing protein n=1 Tax=Candidatus Termititenax persephonae TaxID=2218525 RepID=A0A388TH21_9BACT|nr:hypothetical protein NO2_0969 [Candidatus Termititenax persephonae]
MLLAAGQVNIFTGDSAAEIFIDGQFIAKEQVVQHPLSAGTHYLQVKKNNAVFKSRTIETQDGQTETIVLDDFVDYKTNVPSRGSLEMEALRVRETRGNMAFGWHGGSPASGLSLKWWPGEKLGLQAVGYANKFDDNQDTRAGGRLLFSLNESVFQNSTFTTYLALGVGRSALLNTVDENKNETYDLLEAALGLEFKIADFFKNDGGTRTRQVVISNESSALNVLLAEFLIGLGEGILKMAHWSGEIGVERIFTRYFSPDADQPSSEVLRLKFSGGCHIYF